MKKFEYKRATVAAEDMENLNLLGKQGWQVVHGNSQRKVDDYLLMREVGDEPNTYELAAKAMAESGAAVRQMVAEEKNQCALCRLKPWTRRVPCAFYQDSVEGKKGYAYVCDTCYPNTQPVETPTKCACCKTADASINYQNALGTITSVCHACYSHAGETAKQQKKAEELLKQQEILCHKCGVFASDHMLDGTYYCVHCLINRVEVFASMLTKSYDPRKPPVVRDCGQCCDGYIYDYDAEQWLWCHSCDNVPRKLPGYKPRRLA